MKLLTLNTHSYMEVDFEEKLLQLIEMLVQTQPDLIAFQEVNQSLTAVIITPDAFYQPVEDRKSTRLNSSHHSISYAVFYLKKTNAAGYDDSYLRYFSEIVDFNKITKDV